MGRPDAHDTVRHAADAVGERADAIIDAVKPRLRGVIHAGTAPVALVLGIVLVVLAPAGAPRTSTAVFAVTAVLLFGTSAVYHRGTWSAPVGAALRRLDHANIFLLIAGTYTPLAVLLLPADTARVLLTVVWVGAAAGILMRVFWLGAPRWLYVPIYIALGWVAVWFLPDFFRNGSPSIMWLVIAGGVSYTAGAVVYGLKRPNPSPRWFGFHEIFHVGTVGGYLCHAAAVLLALLAAR